MKEKVTGILVALIPVALGVAAGMWLNEIRIKKMGA